MTHKFCTRCNVDREIGWFLKNDRFSDGFAPWCRPCRVGYSREWRERKKETIDGYKKKARAKKFGLTLEQYESMVTEQGNCCAICGKSRAEQANELAIDHCHASGRVRALLCNFCNTLLGLAQDDVRILASAISYLKVHKS